MIKIKRNECLNYLGCKSPGRSRELKIDGDGMSITVLANVKLKKSKQLCCLICGKESPYYDSRKRKWHHVNYGEYNTYIEAHVPRVRCSEHGVTVTQVPWADRRSRYTALLESNVIDQLKDGSVRSVSQHFRLGWDAIDGIKSRAVQRGLERREVKVPEDIGIDEVAYKKGHNYFTVISDTKNNRALNIEDGRKQIEMLSKGSNNLSAEQIGQIRSVSMDMWKPYINGIRRSIPEAENKIAFDRFHVMKYLTKSVHTVRKQEQRAQIKKGNPVPSQRLKIFLAF